MGREALQPSQLGWRAGQKHRSLHVNTFRVPGVLYTNMTKGCQGVLPRGRAEGAVYGRIWPYIEPHRALEPPRAL